MNQEQKSNGGNPALQPWEGKGFISRQDAAKKAGGMYAEFRKKQDADCISEFDRRTAKHLKGDHHD